MQDAGSRRGVHWGSRRGASAVLSLQHGEGLTQGPLGGHESQVSGGELRAEDGQELSMEAWGKQRLLRRG